MVEAIRAQTPRVVSGLAILAVATVAGVVSYQHIEDLSLSLHQTLLAARLMPIGIDGLITVGSVVLLQGGRLGWLGIGPGVAIALFANVESGIRYGWLAATWAGIPAVSFALASFILERWVAQQAGAHMAAVAETPQAVTEAETVADTEGEAASTSEPASEPASASAAGTAPDEPASETVAGASRVGMTFDEAAREFAAEIDAGEVPSLREIQARAHTGRPRAKKIRTHLTVLRDARLLAPTAARARVREPVGL